MNKCDYCGEFKKVKKIFLLYDGNHGRIMSIFGFYTFNYCCKDCFDAIEMVSKDNLRQREIEKEKMRVDWIKKRNKILENKRED